MELWLVVEPTPSEKYATVKMGEDLPQIFGVKIQKKYLKAPPTSSMEA